MNSKAVCAASLTTLVGVDFTSNPSRRKPITTAFGTRQGSTVTLDRLQPHATFASYEAWLQEPAAWFGAFDFPFGLPRAFVDANGLGDTSEAVLRRVHERAGNRMGFRQFVDAWGNTQPAGQRLLHRRCDLAMPGVQSTSPLQTRYVPVGLMYFEGLARLLDAGIRLPGLHEPTGGAAAATRVAIEGYPGLLAHELIGRRSYKNKDEPDRLIARKEIVDLLEQGRSRLGLRLRLTHAKREQLVDDPSGDQLDAVLCLMQAAWASAEPGHGLPPDMDAVEGWVATVPSLAVLQAA